MAAVVGFQTFFQAVLVVLAVLGVPVVHQELVILDADHHHQAFEWMMHSMMPVSVIIDLQDSDSSII